ncbi:family 16 glycoside hydrolase [Paenibacillus wynnii]|uniref:family 16 glycoside hydrolase n=1 Tax=Paenibacillus wynnii TaxID=268407 RepID=UPI00068BC088|nr:family 16 glycoside hydrolase [Paenibacillus wynnii]
MKRSYIIVGILLLCFATAGCKTQQGQANNSTITLPETNETTMDLTFDEASEGWEFALGKWERRQSQEQQWVLAQTETTEQYPVALYKKNRFSDLDVTVRFKPLSGSEDASGGLIIRAQNSKNYYLVRGNSLEGNFRLYAVVQGSRKELVSVNVEPPKLGEWHTIRLIMIGSQIEAYLDGDLLINFTDKLYADGWIGLWTKADSVTEFSDLKIKGSIVQ